MFVYSMSPQLIGSRVKSYSALTNELLPWEFGIGTKKSQTEKI